MKLYYTQLKNWPEVSLRVANPYHWMLLFLRVKYKKTKLFLTKYLGRGRVIFKNYQITKPFNPFNTTLFIASAEPDTALLTKVTMLCTVFFHTKKNITQFTVCTVFHLEFLWEDIIFWKNFVHAICSIWNNLSYDVKFVYYYLNFVCKISG